MLSSKPKGEAISMVQPGSILSPISESSLSGAKSPTAPEGHREQAEDRLTQTSVHIASTAEAAYYTDAL